MKRLLAIVLALTMVFGLAACGQNNTNGSNTNNAVEPEAPKEVVLGISSEPASLDPQATGFNGGVSMTGLMIYDTLLHWNNDKGTVEPNVITEWNWDDPTSLHIKIRKDVVSHDGYPITTEDIKFMFERGTSFKGLARYYSDFDPENFKIIDDYEMIIKTKNTSPATLTNLTLISFSVMSKKGFEAAGGTDSISKKPVSATGRYKFVEWVDGDHVTLEANENYWGEKPAYKTVTVKFLTDASAQLMALQKGDVAAINRVAQSETDIISNDKNLVLYENPNIQNLYHVYLDNSKGPLGNIKVRQALSMAINREAVLKSCFFGKGQVADGLFATFFPLYTAPKSGEEFKYDVEAAKALLREAGYENGFTIKMITSQTQAYRDIARSVQNAWAEIGVKVDIETSDSATFFKKQGAGEYDAYVLATTGVNYINVVKTYDNRLTYAQSGNTQYVSSNDEEVHKIIDSLYAELDITKAKEYAAQLQSFVRTEFPSIPLVNTSSLCASSADVQGIILDAMGNPDFVGIAPKK